jgi:hypothetical protein
MAANAMDAAAIQAMIDAAVAGQDANAIQVMIDAAVAAQIAALPAPAVQPVPPAGPAAFALTPGLLNVATPWDYSSSEGIKLFFASTKSLETKYDGQQTGLKVFLRSISTKAKTFGWDTLVLTIPDGAPVPVNRNLLTQYGLLTIANVTAAANIYIGTNTRAAQASAQLAQCITASLEQGITLKLLLRGEEFMIGGVEDGPCMLKTLISVVNIQTRATVSCVRSALKRLPELMQELESDVTKFNMVVGSHIDNLNAMGATCEDLLNHLFEAYQSTSNSDLNEYVKDKENKWEDHTIPDMTPATLMTLAEEKFKTIAQKKMHKAPLASAKEDAHIVALSSQIEELLAFKAEFSNRETQGNGGSGRSRKAKEAEWAWKSIEPTASQPKEKKFKGKDYVHCPFHGTTKWVLKSNHEGGCRNDPAKKSSPPATAGTPDKRTLQYAKALMTAMDLSGEQEAIEDEEV